MSKHRQRKIQRVSPKPATICKLLHIELDILGMLPMQAID